MGQAVYHYTNFTFICVPAAASLASPPPFTVGSPASPPAPAGSAGNGTGPQDADDISSGGGSSWLAPLIGALAGAAVVAALVAGGVFLLYTHRRKARAAAARAAAGKLEDPLSGVVVLEAGDRTPLSSDKGSSSQLGHSGTSGRPGAGGAGAAGGLAAATLWSARCESWLQPARKTSAACIAVCSRASAGVYLLCTLNEAGCGAA